MTMPDLSQSSVWSDGPSDETLESWCSRCYELCEARSLSLGAPRESVCSTYDSGVRRAFAEVALLFDHYELALGPIAGQSPEEVDGWG